MNVYILIKCLITICPICRPPSYYTRRTKYKQIKRDMAQTGHIITENGGLSTTKSTALHKQTAYGKIDENGSTLNHDENGVSSLKSAIITNGTTSLGDGVSEATVKQRNNPTADTTALPVMEFASGYPNKERSGSRASGSGDSVTVSETSRSSTVSEPAWKVLTNGVVIKYAVCVSLAHTGYGNVFTMLPEHGKDMDATDEYTTLLLSIMGGADIAAAVLVSAFSNANIVRRADLFIGAIVINGAMFFVAPLVTDSVRLGLFAVVLVITGVAFIVLVPVLLAEEVGVKRLPMSLGVTNMAVGLVFLFSAVGIGM